MDDLFDADLQGAERLAQAPGRWPQQLVELSDLVLDEIQAASDLSPALARRLAYRVVARITREYGGDHWYIPKPDSLRRVLRDIDLWASHDGTVDGPRGINALAKQHGVSTIRIWAILRQQREMHIKSLQPDLFVNG